MLKRTVNLPKSNHFFLFGPRQTGKTTLINEQFTDAKLFYISLLNNKNFLKYAPNPSIFAEEVYKLSPEISHICLDEVQRIPELLNEVQILIDKKIPQKFILTGSSARKLKRGKGNLLGGRAWTRKLHPLTMSELKDSFDLQKALSVGTLPAVYLENDLKSSQEMLNSYIETYLKEEIEDEALSRSLGAFIRFLRVAAQSNAEQLSFSNISRDVGLSSVTIKEYFKILEDTLIGNFLMPFSFSERKKHKTSPKFYWFDTGVVRAARGLSNSILEIPSFESGILFETWVINEVSRINDYYQKNWVLSFLRTANDVEVDLIIELPNRDYWAIEIKIKTTPTKTDFESGFNAIKKLVDKNLRCVCVCTGEKSRLVGDVDVLNYREFFSELISVSS